MSVESSILFIADTCQQRKATAVTKSKIKTIISFRDQQKLAALDTLSRKINCSRLLMTGLISVKFSFLTYKKKVCQL